MNGLVGKNERSRFETEIEEELKLERIGERIRDIRKSKGLTQGQFGKMIGVKKSAVSKLENNTRDIRVSTLSRALAALGLSFHVE